ncbi:MAG: amidohydrolase family protein [Bacteroidales bacterium]|nr:amidohydrolase family protein [Bacteroidales bacterium]
MDKVKFRLTCVILVIFASSGKGQDNIVLSPLQGYEQRISKYVDSLRIIDTHEHLFDPRYLKQTNFLDFILLFQQSGYDDLISAGMPDTLFNTLFNKPLTPVQKWKIIEPYWKNSFNTSFNRTILLAFKNLYGITDLNASTVGPLSERIKKAYNTDWFDRILRDSCRIDFVIQDGSNIVGKDDYFRYSKRFESWLTVKSKFRIDSLAVMQIEPIYTLEDFVKSMRIAFEDAVKKRMAVVKINIAYKRSLSFEKTETEAARKIFRSLVNSDEGHVISNKEASPLQDYMFYQLLDLAGKYRIPVAFHTGFQAGKGNIIGNSDPTLLTNVFSAYPDINFVLYHGGYPYGGELSTLAKNYPNVHIDMNWVYSISPTYSERYLSEWIETVPVSKLMAFGGDFRCVENIYSELKIARRIISDVLCNKIREGYLSEAEARTIAKIILYDNAARLYKLK